NLNIQRMIAIDLENIYEPLAITIERQIAILDFNAPQKDGNTKLVRAIISPHPDKLLPNVYNLAMGPLDETGELNDKIRLRHVDSNKLFSTIILFVITFLTEFGEMTIGLDGSDDLRATLYHSMFLLNKKTLGNVFITIGVDWYVKLLRDGSIEQMRNGSFFFRPLTEPFDYKRTRYDLYRYYMLRLKD
ncbi:MAG: DUF6934 family protein, partial [Bacteroidia bacterium]